MKKNFFTIALLGLVAMACTSSKGGFVAGESRYDFYGEGEPDSVAPGGGQGGGGEAGVVTAAEWNDLLNWDFWGGLMKGEWSNYNTFWGLNTSKRVAVKVADESGNPVNRCAVSLVCGERKYWETLTDNKGEANLWLAVTDIQDQTQIENCSIIIDGIKQESAPLLWTFSATEPVVNEYTVQAKDVVYPNVDIAFIVDATGSMQDEIDFLKKDLQDILSNVRQMQTSHSLYTGTVFYRDQGDLYLTRHSAFTTDISSTIAFIGEQEADGGGDIPEAVHTALEVALKQLQWHNDAYAKLAFLVLDAPAHHDHQGVIESMQASIAGYAAKGIKIIPVFCSSWEKECEFMSRQFAILTGGTYVFLTDDSGVGGDHIQATVGQYQIEHLNNLLYRLILKYTE